MALSLLSQIPPSASSLSPVYSLYHLKGSIRTSVLGGFRSSWNLRIDSVAEKRQLGLMVSRNGEGGGELDDMDEGQIESICGQDEDDEEWTQAHTSSSSSSSPERWDVLGLGQAMVSFLSSCGFEKC